MNASSFHTLFLALLWASVTYLPKQLNAQETCSTASGKIDECIVFLLIDKIDINTGATVQVPATGFLIGKDGWVLTAAHPLINKIPSTPGQPEAEAIYPPPVRGRLGKRNPQPDEDLRVDTIVREHDLALLQFKSFSNPRKFFSIGRASDVNVNTTSLKARGFPLDKDLDVRDVKVSSKGGTTPMWNLDGALTFGYSGAPLLNSDGAVVAVVIGDDARGSEIKYATPINLAHALAAKAEARFAAGNAQTATPSATTVRHEVRVTDHEAEDEDRIVRPHVWAYPLPNGSVIRSANISVRSSQGLKSAPTLDIGAKSISVIFELESGPRSTGRRGSLNADLEITLAPPK